MYYQIIILLVKREQLWNRVLVHAYYKKMLKDTALTAPLNGAKNRQNTFQNVFLLSMNGYELNCPRHLHE